MTFFFKKKNKLLNANRDNSQCQRLSPVKPKEGKAVLSDYSG